jgi:hypothetical protein
MVMVQNFEFVSDKFNLVWHCNGVNLIISLFSVNKEDFLMTLLT